MHADDRPGEAAPEPASASAPAPTAAQASASAPVPARPEPAQTSAPPRSARAAIEVLATGPLALIEDQGRPGFAHLGVTASGAADRAAFAAANRLVGNPPGAAAIETVFGGLEVRALQSVLVAVTGAEASVFHTRTGTADTQAIEQPSGCSIPLLAGESLLIGAPTVGLRSYLAVRGGIGADPVLGSRSTDVLSGLGPPPLAADSRLSLALDLDRSPAGHAADPGERYTEWCSEPDTASDWPRAALIPPLAVGSGRAAAAASGWENGPQAVLLELIRGPRDDWFGNAGWSTLIETPWTVGADSNRVGIRLSATATPTADVGAGAAPAITRLRDRADDELPSEGMVAGAVQIPPSGQPVIFHRDHPVTGGYPVIGVLTATALDRAAQLRPGDAVRFREQN